MAGFIADARVPAALALKNGLPCVRAAAFILRERFDAAVRAPKYAELLFALAGNAPNLRDEPPPICRGVADRPLLELLPLECPPPKWNPPPPLPWERPPWNPPPPPLWEWPPP